MLNENVGHHGTFQLHGLDVWGELILSGANTQLRLRTEGQPAELSAPEVLHGRLHDFTLVSCVHCVGGSIPTRAWNGDDKTASSWRVFPHQVLSGRSYFNPCEDRIRKVWFSTGDIYRIFDDFDSFGILTDPTLKLQSLLPRTIGDRQVPIGPEPRFVYFSGRCTLLEASLSFGKLEVQHRPLAKANSQEARITSQIRVQVEFETAVDLNECLRKIASIGQFLSLVAGRSQGIENVQVSIDGRDSKEFPLSLHWSLGPQQAKGQVLDTPSWFDMPLDGVRRADEFRQVIERWFSSNEHDLARARLHSCLEAGNHFDVDRLVAAANMFDLRDTTTLVEIPQDLKKIRDECVDAIQALPRSDDRGDALMVLSLIGKANLKKKALSRAAVLHGHFHLADLDRVLRQAVLCRNYFVHGSGDKRFNYAVVKSHISFLTETLEFVFAAAELIECGWAAGDWRLRFHTGYHWLNRYISEYMRASQELLSDLDRAKKVGSSKRNAHAG